MRILHLCPIIPFPPLGGGRTRTFSLLREVAARHQIHFLAMSNQATDQYRPVLEGICQTVELFPFPALRPLSRKRQMFCRTPRRLREFYSPALQERVRQVLIDKHFDLVHVEDMVMAQYLLDLPSTPPVVVSRQKIEWEFERNVIQHRIWGRERFHLTAEMLKLLWFERRVASRRWHHIVPSEQDREQTLRLNRRLSVSVLPNGTDTEYFRPQPPVNMPVISFVGTMCYEPNVDGVHYFFQQVYPHLIGKVEGLQIQIVGHDPVPSVREFGRLPGVVVTGTVLDARPYFASSALSFVPLRIGGGSRIKILDAMAMGIPTVSTTIGAEGIAYANGRNIFIADSPEDFAGRICQLLGDPALRAQMGREGRRLVEQRYSWQTLGKEMEMMYFQAIEGKAGEKATVVGSDLAVQ